MVRFAIVRIIGLVPTLLLLVTAAFFVIRLAPGGPFDDERALLPDAFLDADYEDLVSAQEPATRRLLDYCGLDFAPACLDFHHHAGPTATASAAQVREPMHTHSVRASRRVAGQLAPMIAAMRDQGVEVE